MLNKKKQKSKYYKEEILMNEISKVIINAINAHKPLGIQIDKK